MMLRRWLAGLWALLRKERVERELDDEIRTHLDMAVEENLHRGMTQKEALRAARRSFGIVESVKEAYRQAGSLYWFDTAVRDVHHGVRMLRRAPAFTATVVLSLSLGIAATVAVFTIIQTVLLRALPYADAQRLVWITSVARELPGQLEVATLPDFIEWRDRAQSLSHIAAYVTGGNNFADGESALRIESARVTSGFLSMLGVQPALGRGFVRGEERPGAGRVVVLSYPFWLQRFGADNDVLGRVIRLDDEPFTVVGVLPEHFVFPRYMAFDIELLRPYTFDAEAERERGFVRSVWVAGRLAPGVGIEAARSELEALRTSLHGRFPATCRRTRGPVCRLPEGVSHLL